MSKVELCKVPDTLRFQWQEEQEMHSAIDIENLTNQVVKYKVKTNKPGLYLVKPMEGMILAKGSVTVGFKRRELTLDNFNMILNNPGQAREKFLIELTCEQEDSVGILQKKEQVAILGVAFTRASTNSTLPSQPPPPTLDWPQPKTKKAPPQDSKVSSAATLAVQKRNELEKLILNRQTLQAKTGSSGMNSFTMGDLINVLVVAFLLGFLIV